MEGKERDWKMPQMSGMPKTPAQLKKPEKPAWSVEIVQQREKGERPPEVRYASKPVCPAPRKPLPAPPLWSPSVSVPMRASCVPEPLRVGLRG